MQFNSRLLNITRLCINISLFLVALVHTDIAVYALQSFSQNNITSCGCFFGESSLNISLSSGILSKTVFWKIQITGRI